VGIIIVERLTSRDVELPLTVPAGIFAGEKAEADAMRRRGVMSFIVMKWRLEFAALTEGGGFLWRRTRPERKHEADIPR
jgi:hypothetical protein